MAEAIITDPRFHRMTLDELKGIKGRSILKETNLCEDVFDLVLPDVMHQVTRF